MKKSELWFIRIVYIVMFIILVGVYELARWGISFFIGGSWVSPIILGIIFTAGLIRIDIHANDTDVSEDILEQQYNYIVIDAKNKITKLHGQVMVESSSPVTKDEILEIEKEWDIVNVFPALVLEADPDDSNINKIKELIEK